MAETTYKAGALVFEHMDEWITRHVLPFIGDLEKDGVNVIVGNDRALQIGPRADGTYPRDYEGENLVTATPDPLGTPAQRQAVKVDGEIRSCQNVFSPHGTTAPLQYAFYGENADPRIRGLAVALGFNNAVLSAPGTTADRNSDILLGLELSREGPMTVRALFEVLRGMANGDMPAYDPSARPREFRYIGGLTLGTYQALGDLPPYIEPFTPISREIVQRLVLHPANAPNAMSDEQLKPDPEVVHFATSWRLDNARRSGYIAELLVAA